MSKMNPLVAPPKTPAPDAMRSAAAWASPRPLSRTLAVGAVDDPLEQAAEQVAERVTTGRHGRNSGLRGPVPLPSGRGMTRPAAPAPASVEQTLHSGGSPLEKGLRTDMEQRFGHDFSHVRVHHGASAARSARDLDAHAYTVGADVVFGAGQFSPHTPAGEKLLAHELTHIVQQQTSAPAVIARQPRRSPPSPGSSEPTRNYDTDVAVMDRSNLESWSTISYWEGKIGALFVTSYSSETAARFKIPEERDAVLAALWWYLQANPGVQIGRKYIRIPAIGRRAAKPGTGEVLYRFDFTPKTADKPKGAVAIFFETEHADSVVTFAPLSPISADGGDKLRQPLEGKRTYLSYHHEGFPDGDVLGYFEKNPEEEKQLFYWLERQGLSFMQLVITRTMDSRAKKPSVRRTTFMVKGSKNAQGQIADLSIILLSPKSFDLTGMFLPSGYDRKDGGDTLLEKIQNADHPTKGDRLGKVTLGQFPADEAMPLKYTIWGYFSGGTRNAEVDATITSLEKKRVFYTIRFRPNNDVDAERIGEEKAGTPLDLTRLDIAAVNGFVSQPDQPEKLRAWLKQRYPRLKPEGQTEAELRASANQSLRADAGKPEWFADNYGIEVLDDARAKTQLKLLGSTNAQLVGMKKFTPDDLQKVEISLQAMSDAFLRQYRGVGLARQATRFAFDRAQQKFVPDPKTGGTTIKSSASSKIIVVIFDAAATHSTERFLGGAGGVRPLEALTIAHELGHALAYRSGLDRRFNQFVKENGIAPFTPYAAKDPQGEFFPEAYALYQMDPAWLRSNQPKVWEWFEARKAELEAKSNAKKP